MKFRPHSVFQQENDPKHAWKLWVEQIINIIINNNWYLEMIIVHNKICDAHLKVGSVSETSQLNSTQPILPGKISTSIYKP